jgi:MerR family redox-sensitive transcriptional activator SoxR
MEELPELTIGEVARRAGVPTSSIRYYESIELLPAPQRVSGQRRYRTDVLGKLGFIGMVQSAGFRLAEIRELIDGVDSAAARPSPCVRSRPRSWTRSRRSSSALRR